MVRSSGHIALHDRTRPDETGRAFDIAAVAAGYGLTDLDGR
jgi:hypothetical protein